MKIYGTSVSVHTRKVILAARILNKDFALAQVVPVVPDTLPANWSELSPTGKIPVVEVDKHVLRDSTVISTYLDRSYGDHCLYPAAADQYLEALWLEEYCDGTMFPEVVRPLFHLIVVQHRLRGQPLEQEKVDAILRDELPPVFDYLESRVCSDYLVGGRLSVADIALFSNLTTYQYTGFPLAGDRYPRLAGYYSRLIGLPVFARVLSDEREAVDSMGLDRSFLA